MKYGKKLLSVLLALVILLSCGMAAFAAPDDYNWTPIPTSPDGLQKGDAYLEFTTEFVEANVPMFYGPEATIDAMNDAAWYVDYEKKLIKGSFGIEPEFEDGNVLGESIDPAYDLNTSVLYYNEAVREVGVDWEPVNLTADLQDGDWYIVPDELKENLIRALMKHDILTEEDARDKIVSEMQDMTVEEFFEAMYPYGVEVYIGKMVRKMRMPVTRYEPETGNLVMTTLVLNPYSDNPEECEWYDATMDSVKRYQAPAAPENPPVEPERKRNVFERLMEAVKNFFNRIRDFFLRIFKR